MDRARAHDRVPVAIQNVKRLRLERAIAAGLGLHRANAIVVIILYRLSPAIDRFVGAGIANNDVVLA